VVHDKEGFRDMISTIDPQYQLPHKDYIIRIAIPALYEDTRQNVLSTLKNGANYYYYYYSGTADLVLVYLRAIFIIYSPLH